MMQQCSKREESLIGLCNFKGKNLKQEVSLVEGPRAPYHIVCTNALCPTGLSKYRNPLEFHAEFGCKPQCKLSG